MRNRQPYAFLGAELHDFVGLGQGPYKGFFDIDAFHARRDGGDNHSMMFMNVPRANGDNVGLSLDQHSPVVAVSPYAAQLLGCSHEAFGIGIGDGDDGGLRYLQPDGILAMPVVTLTGMADHTDGERTLGALGTQQRGGQREAGSGKEVSTMHVTWRCVGS